jgi:hypothetical protein
MSVSRRVFVSSAAAAAAVTSFPNLLLGKAQDAPVILGDGKHRYQWIRNWARLPEGKSFAPTHGCVQTDAKDNVYIATDNADAVMVFDKEGTFVKSWGKDIAGGSVHGMHITKEGDREVLYIAHTGRHKVYKTTLDGEVLLVIPWPEKAGVYANEGAYQPTMVCAAPNGDIYVVGGYGKPNNYVHVFDKEGNWLRCWNGEGTEGGKLNNVHGVWLDHRGKEMLVLAADRGNRRLVHYTPEGKLGRVIAVNLRAPCKAFVQGEDVLVPNLGGNVTILGKDNSVLAVLGTNQGGFGGNFGTPVEKFVDGQFTAPHGATWDSTGDLYVEDWNKFGRVNKLKRLKA